MASSSHKRSIFLIAVLLVVAENALAQPGCIDKVSRLLDCLQPLKKYEKIKPFIPTEDKLDQFCDEWVASQVCVQVIQKQCENEQITSTFRISDNYKRLCNDRNYRREYVKHFGCLQKTTSVCYGRTTPAGGTGPDASADKTRRKQDDQCRWMGEIVTCVQAESRQQCDDEAASFVSRYSTVEAQFLNCDAGSNSASICGSSSIVALALMALFSFKELL